MQSQVLRTEDALVLIGGYLEVARERNLVIAVDGVHDAVVDAQALINTAIETHLVEIGDTQQLALRL